MDGNLNDTECRTDSSAEATARFLAALFADLDVVAFRPIEAWTENGKKRSRVDYKRVTYRPAAPDILAETVSWLRTHSEGERTNLFFGVCPRVGGEGRFDFAWQIRTVRALWTDIDHITVENARQRIAQSSLPAPSILVNSGNGVHVYWLLDQPYQINDADPPPPVLTEWSEGPNGKRRARKYIVENDERVFLDQRKRLELFSPQAQRVQDVLAGIALKLQGDHTTDLSRLLRLPGTLNRKDERNGREPVATQLIVCDPDRRYAFADFEGFAAESPHTERVKKIAVMPLPQIRKKPAAAKADRLAELIATCSIAAPGVRSEADFGLCCFAVKNGFEKEQVWSQVESIGKFQDQGRRYFDVTWENAEYEVRATLYAKLTPKATAVPETPGEYERAEPVSGSGDDDVPADEERPTIRVNVAEDQVADTLKHVTDCLIAAKDCFNRAEQLVVVQRDEIKAVLSPPELSGLLNQHVEFFFVGDDGNAGGYKPFPPNYANTWLNKFSERMRLPVLRLFTRNPVYTEDWRLVSPGYDPASGIYYAGPAIQPRTGTECLDAMLRDFCFKSVADRTNYLGMLLTTLLVPRFIGSKPAVLFNGNQPELGKSILAQMLAILRDGSVTETVSYNPNDEEFEKRLGAVVRRGATTIIIDNAKTRGRNPRIESACLERSITDPILSFRLLGQSDSIRAENSHIFCLTANAPDVSRDLVTRSVVVNLHFDGNPERRTFSIPDPESFVQANRNEILGELVGLVEQWKASGMRKATTHSRFNKKDWGNLIGGILQACGEEDFLVNADESSLALDDTRREFAELVTVLADHPQGTWTAAELSAECGKHGLLRDELGEGSPRSQATRFGVIAGRYVAERFDIRDRVATFVREEDRNGKVYRVGLEAKVRNV